MPLGSVTRLHFAEPHQHFLSHRPAALTGGTCSALVAWLEDVGKAPVPRGLRSGGSS
jgi:hypothetical protein